VKPQLNAGTFQIQKSAKQAAQNTTQGIIIVYIQDKMFTITSNHYMGNKTKEKGENEQDPNKAMYYDTEQGIGPPVWIRVTQKLNIVDIYICTTW
jgi:hypothetical protein